MLMPTQNSKRVDRTREFHGFSNSGMAKEDGAVDVINGIIRLSQLNGITGKSMPS